MRGRLATITAWLLAASPLLWMALLYLFVVRARLELGRWPTPYHPDPKDLGFPLHHGLLWLTSAVLPALVIGGALAGFVRGNVRPSRWRLLALSVASTAALLTTAQIDPGNYFNWFAD